ncbi:MAG: glycosyltransferase [Verrucomicrobia bacterium]|nr:glycosyltransferase [Verrucomicrobiota bacterium]
MKLSVIINTFNEGGRVTATCRDFLAAGADEVIVCADGTTDGSCDALPDGVRVVKHDKPLGCGKAKLAATAAATGDALLWVDAHQTVLAGDIRALAGRAVESGAIVCPALANIAYDANWRAYRLPGSQRVFHPNNEAILPFSTSQYRRAPEPSPLMVGVGLCMSRDTYARVGGWNTFAGRHGSQERGMALRAFMSGVPVVSLDDVMLGHEFFGTTHPSRNSDGGQYRFNNIVPAWMNVWHAYYAVCGETAFRERIIPWLHRCGCGPADAIADRALTAEARLDHELFERASKRVADDALLAMLETLALKTHFPLSPVSNLKSPISNVPTNSMHSFVPVLEQWLDRIKPTSVLEWGPGASSRVILGRLPSGARLTSIEHDDTWLQRARASVPPCAARWDTLLEPVNRRVSRYAHRALDIRPAPQLIFIDGRRRVECALAAIQVLAPGGVIILHDARRTAYTDLLRGHIRILAHEADTLVFAPLAAPPRPSGGRPAAVTP